MPIDFYVLVFPIGTILVIGLIGKYLIVTASGKDRHNALKDFDKELREHGNFCRGKDLSNKK